MEIPKPNVSGIWKNDLGSVMTLEEKKPKGEETNIVPFSGTYGTAVEFNFSNKNASVFAAAEESAHLEGYTNTQVIDGNLTTTITFCMAWEKEGSCSAFTGQIFQDKDGADVIETTWLLHSPVNSQKDNWEATRVGKNTFTRYPPVRT